jgi:broad specificity phosphatase PhoE
MSTLYLVRHGQASFGQADYDNLSPLGIRQSQILANSLAQRGLVPDAAFTGAMKRHLQTAEPLNPALSQAGLPECEFIQSKAFDEFDAATVWQRQINRMVEEDPQVRIDLDKMASDPKAFNRLFAKVMRQWVSGNVDPEIAPRWQDFTQRVRQGVRQIMETHPSKKKVAVFTSAGPVAATVQMALSLSDAKTMELAFQILNASVTAFTYSPKGIILSVFNDTGHLAAANEPGLLTIR